MTRRESEPQADPFAPHTSERAVAVDLIAPTVPGRFVVVEDGEVRRVVIRVEQVEELGRNCKESVRGGWVLGSGL